MSQLAAPDAAPARPGRAAGGPWFASMTAMWLAFAVLLLASPETLDRFWHWVRALPLVAEAALWLLLLPWLLGLAVWESSWDAWLRVLVVVLLAAFWSGLSAPREPEAAAKRRSRRRAVRR